jgi:hypothetical protein
MLYYHLLELQHLLISEEGLFEVAVPLFLPYYQPFSVESETHLQLRVFGY